MTRNNSKAGEESPRRPKLDQPKKSGRSEIHYHFYHKTEYDIVRVSQRFTFHVEVNKLPNPRSNSFRAKLGYIIQLPL